MEQKRKHLNHWLRPITNIFGKLRGIKCYLPLLFDVKYLTLITTALLFAEVPVNNLMIKWYGYAEVDWTTYMQQVEVMINGTLDYSKITGQNGPCVYPAGYVYIYTILYHLHQAGGKNIVFCQHIFSGLYISTLALVFQLYIKSKRVPPYALIIICCISHRLHAIYLLQLFNDSIAMLLLYLSLNLFVRSRWNWGSAVYSLAVSVKMNILLFSPPLLLTYWVCLGFTGTLEQLIICAGVQLCLGAPFLLANPLAYIKASFDFGHVFCHLQSMNMRFVPEHIFKHKYFYITLLAVHVLLLAIFYSTWKKYLTSYAQLKEMEDHVKPELGKCKRCLGIGSASNLFLEHIKSELRKREKSLEVSSASGSFLDCVKPGLQQDKKSLDPSSASNLFLKPTRTELDHEKSLDTSFASNRFLDSIKPELKEHRRSLELNSESCMLLDCIKQELIEHKKSSDMTTALNSFSDHFKPNLEKSARKWETLASELLTDHIEQVLVTRKKSSDIDSAANLFLDHIKPELEEHKKSLDLSIASNLLLTPMFTANLIGVACSRSLHMQFCAWYYHSLPYLLWSTKFPDMFRVLILIVIELCWDTYVSTVLSCAALHICHIAILYGLYQNRYTLLSSLIYEIRTSEHRHGLHSTLLGNLPFFTVFFGVFAFFFACYFLFIFSNFAISYIISGNINLPSRHHLFE